MWTAHKNSNTGRSKVHALTWVLVRSYSWNLVDKIGINEAGQSVLASKISLRTRGGTIRLDFPQKTGGFWSGMTKDATLSTEVAYFKSCHKGVVVSKSVKELMGSMR